MKAKKRKFVKKDLICLKIPINLGKKSFGY